MPLIFSLFLVAVPLYVCERLLSAFVSPLAALALSALILVPALALVRVSMRARRMTETRAGRRLAWAGLLLMSLFSSLFALAVLRDVTLLAVWLVASSALTAWLVPSALGAMLLALLFTTAGLYVARRPRVVRVDIPIPNLHEALRGFSIVQISDIHVGPTIRRGFVQHLVERVNALGADLVAVTGDLVDGSVSQLTTQTAPLSGLAAPYGVYFVTGNHEYYSGEPAWSAEIRRLGIRVLKNEHVVVQHGGANLVLAGVTDVSAHHFDPAQRSDPARALMGAPPGAPRILLAHQPSSAVAAAEAGFDVQLSGHTHGGQFWPWNLFIRFFQPFTAGLNRLQRLLVYVNRGTGYWGPPNRFGVRGEITHIRLLPA